MTAKSTPYLSCHRDYFPAKVTGPEAGWLRQVTQPPFIAGPLGVRVQFHNTMTPNAQARVWQLSHTINLSLPNTCFFANKGPQCDDDYLTLRF
jgi:hypothetical protein